MSTNSILRLSVKPYIERAKLSNITLTDEELGRYVKAALRSSCELLRDYARTHHRYKDDTGKLTRDIKYNTYDGTRSKNKANWHGKVGYIYTDARPEYAKWQLYGTGIYNPDRNRKIYPKKASVLKFKNGAYRRFARGIKGQDYLRNALVRNKLKIDKIFEEALEMAVRYGKH